MVFLRIITNKHTDERFKNSRYGLLSESKLADCTSEKWATINDFDYIIVSFDTTINCLNQNNIKYEIVRQYDNHRVIHLFD